MFWAQSLLAGNGAGVTCLRESRLPITTLNIATYVTPLMARNFWGVHADVIVYIFAHLHTALLTEINMLDMN